MQLEEHELRTLMLSGLSGDAEAHTRLLRRLAGQLRSYFTERLVRLARETGDAETLVQETLIALHTRRLTYDPSKLLIPWVQAIARYKLIDYLRRSKASTRYPRSET